MKPFFEKIVPESGSSWAFLDRRLKRGIPFEWHHHPEYELTLTLNSRGFRYIGDDVEAYDDGDLVLVGPGIPHSWCSHEVIDPREPHVALVIWFTRDWIARLTDSFPEMAPMMSVLTRATQGLCFSRKACEAVSPAIREMRKASPVERSLLLLNVLNVLCRDRRAKALATAARPEIVEIDPRVSRVLDYLHMHYAEHITVKKLARLACTSVSGFHRMFRRHVHMPMVTYLTQLRVGRACSLLIGSALPIASIALDVGYTNLSLFNRQFARLKGETPSRFRKRHQEMLIELMLPSGNARST
jgi:AraC-like DNA-binding protein